MNERASMCAKKESFSYKFIFRVFRVSLSLGFVANEDRIYVVGRKKAKRIRRKFVFTTCSQCVFCVCWDEDKFHIVKLKSKTNWMEWNPRTSCVRFFCVA